MLEKNILENIRQLVKNEAEEDDWKYHIVPVVKYAKELAKILNADEDVAELAALLHDIGRLRFESGDHDVTGVPEAEKILKELNCPSEIIDEVKHCVESHRGSKNVVPKTIIAKIIANADAMAHFDILPVFFFWRSQDSSFEEAFKWVDEKIDRDWDKKLTLPEARKLMVDKHNAIRLILNANREYI
jgi:uncharacterized protein